MDPLPRVSSMLALKSLGGWYPGTSPRSKDQWWDCFFPLAKALRYDILLGVLFLSYFEMYTTINNNYNYYTTNTLTHSYNSINLFTFHNIYPNLYFSCCEIVTTSWFMICLPHKPHSLLYTWHHKVTATYSSYSVGASQDLWFVYSPAAVRDHLMAVNSV